MGNVAWKLLSMVVTIAATKAAKSATDGTWKAAMGKPAPKNQHDPSASNKQAALYAIASTAAIAGAKVLATRKAADYYTKSAGHPPEALQKKADKATEKRQKQQAQA